MIEAIGWQHDTGISLSCYDGAQGLWPSGQPNISQDYMLYVVNTIQFLTVISLVMPGMRTHR